jgi:hypothetical protein
VQQVQDGLKDPGEVDCNGPPLFCLSTDLHYTDPSTFWLVGPAHALLYGPVCHPVHSLQLLLVSMAATLVLCTQAFMYLLKP